MSLWVVKVVGPCLLFLGACVTPEPGSKGESSPSIPPERVLHDEPGSIETNGPGGSEVEHDYCRPGTTPEPDQVLGPQVEVGVSIPLGGDREEPTEVVPYSRSSCVPH